MESRLSHVFQCLGKWCILNITSKRRICAREDAEVETISKTSLSLRFVAEGLVCHARSFLGSIEASMKLGLVVQVSGNLSCARQSFVHVAPRDV